MTTDPYCQSVTDNCATHRRLQFPKTDQRLIWLNLHIQGGPKKWIPSFIFGITSVIQQRF